MLQTLRDGGIVTLVLERPERGNALSAGFVESLIAAAGRAMEDAGVHTLILRGAGRHFCTGLDLSDLEQTSDGELLHRLVRIETLLAGLWHAPVRTVAVARITMPRAKVRLSAGRRQMDESTQVLCFLAGANSIFYGDKLLVTGNPDVEADQDLLARTGMHTTRAHA